MCPTFVTWPPAYKTVSSVCVYVIPTDKCKKEGTPARAGAVDCMYINDESNQQVGVIYACVDFDLQEKRLLFEKKSKSDKLANKIDYGSFLTKSCGNPAYNMSLCTGRGTCRPQESKKEKYFCSCNVGYKGIHCEKIDSNKCTNIAQCAAGICNLNKQECECEEGTIGDQCAFCSPNSPQACNKNGKCKVPQKTLSDDSSMMMNTSKMDFSQATANASSRFLQMSMAGSQDSDSDSKSQDNAVCVCDPGWQGTHCERSTDESKNSTGDDVPSDSSDAAHSLASISAFAVMLVTLVAFH